MKNIVVTGAARGFGREIALLATQKGYRVFASVRKWDDAAKSLQVAGVTCEIMEMNDPASIDAFAARASEWCAGSLYALVNNAGVAYPGPVELISRDDLLSQFQINVFGQIQLTQRLLPELKAAGGRIMMVSSQGALLSAPMVGAYSASKRALEAFAETLVMELQGCVQVCVVRPGPYATSIWDQSISLGEKGSYENTPYAAMALAIRSLATSGTMGNPQELAKKMLRILESRKMLFIYGAPFSAQLTMALRRVLPSRLFFAITNYVVSKEINKQLSVRPK